MDSDTAEVQPRMDFYGVSVSSGTTVEVPIQNVEDSSVILHITQVALGANPKAGPHTVFVVRDGQEFAIGTLEKGRCEQFSVELSCTTDLSFRHSGQTDIHLTGYRLVVCSQLPDGGPSRQLLSRRVQSTRRVSVHFSAYLWHPVVHGTQLLWSAG